jgi:hypothetical protein
MEDRGLSGKSMFWEISPAGGGHLDRCSTNHE